MNHKASSAVIGLFVLGAVAVILASIVFFSGGDFLKEKDRFVLYFDRTVQGLEIGAPVKLRGVKLGEVTAIQTHVLVKEKSVVTAVYIETYPGDIHYDLARGNEGIFDELLERRGMRAQLRIQSLLTGLLYIEVDFKPGDPDLKLYGLDPDTEEIPTAHSEIEELSDILNEIDFDAIASSFGRIADNLDRFVSDEEFLALAGNLNATMASIRTLADDADVAVNADLRPAVNEIKKLVAGINQDYPQLAADFGSSMARLETSLSKLETAMAGAGHLLSDDSPLLYEVNATLVQLKKASRDLAKLAETLERQPEALVRGKQP